MTAFVSNVFARRRRTALQLDGEPQAAVSGWARLTVAPRL